jgi:hypothetical protein
MVPPSPKLSHPPHVHVINLMFHIKQFVVSATDNQHLLQYLITSFNAFFLFQFMFILFLFFIYFSPNYFIPLSLPIFYSMIPFFFLSFLPVSLFSLICSPVYYLLTCFLSSSLYFVPSVFTFLPSNVSLH